jgi:hypothetical protein
MNLYYDKDRLDLSWLQANYKLRHLADNRKRTKSERGYYWGNEYMKQLKPFLRSLSSGSLHNRLVKIK